MNMGAAMIAAVSMGMSVDSSIHYFVCVPPRPPRRQKRPRRADQCQQSVGLAMIFSTIALIVGFGVLITSDFVPTIYFGALMSLAMLGGMLGNLIVLPLLLSWTEREPPIVARSASEGIRLSTPTDILRHQPPHLLLPKHPRLPRQLRQLKRRDQSRG